jgi:hypothetical protein
LSAIAGLDRRRQAIRPRRERYRQHPWRTEAAFRASHRKTGHACAALPARLAGCAGARAKFPSPSRRGGA